MKRVVQDLSWSSYVRTLKLKQRSETTIRDYGYSYRTFSTWLGKPAVEATRLDVEGWLEARLERVSPTRVAQDQLNMKIFYNWAVAEEIITRHPMNRIPRIVVKPKPPRVIDPADMKALRESCKGKKFMDVRDAAILGVLTLVGTPRMGELISMRLDGVDLRNDLLTVPAGKTVGRVLPLSTSAALLMERYLRARAKHHAAASEWLWVGKKGRLTRTGVQMILERRAKQAGVTERIHAHLFRHDSATRAADAGLGDSDLEYCYGWQPGSPMKNYYTRATRASRAQAAARTIGDRL